MVRPVLGAVVVMMMWAGVASAGTGDVYQLAVDRQGSSVGFSISAKMLFTIKKDGSFHDFSGSVQYDPADPAKTQVDLTIYTASVDLKSAENESLLRSEEFFDVGNHPTMHFVSTAVSARADGALDVAGDLTIRGVTKHIVIPVTVIRRAGLATQAAFDTRFQIDRTDFGLNGGGPRSKSLKVSIGRNVDIHLAITAAGSVLSPKR